VDDDADDGTRRKPENEEEENEDEDRIEGRSLEESSVQNNCERRGRRGP